MDPVTSIGLAASIVQLLTFTSNIITKSCEIHAHGDLHENAELEAIASSLQSLSKDISIPENPTSTESHLQILCEECNDLAKELVGAIQSLKEKSSHGPWRSFRQALLTVWKEKDIKALSARIERQRSQIDTFLLADLRAQIQKLDPDFSRPTEEVRWKILLDKSRSWEANIVDELHRNNWKLKNEQDLTMFSTNLSETVGQRRNQLNKRRILENLRFSDMGDRYERIAEAHQKTFQWIFSETHGSQGDSPTDEEGGQSPKTQLDEQKLQSYHQGDFVNWLRGNENLFWITGKPGAGKSTLMKYLFNIPLTLRHLDDWVGSEKLVTAGFFFWNSGTVMQKSREGLLRALLYEVLKTRPNDVPDHFPDRWSYYELFGTDIRPWSWQELTAALEILMSDTSKKFFFAIDGLDEFDGNCSELASWVFRVSSRPNVKICAASRPWLVFEDSFGSRPSLRVEELTVNDIHTFASEHLRSHARFMQFQDLYPDSAESLISEICKRASGVFLWVRLVVLSLTEGLQDGDTLEDLQDRLRVLPPDLEDLFQRMMDTLKPSYRREALRMIQMVHAAAHRPMSILSLSFAGKSIEEALSATLCPLEPAKSAYQVESTRRRLSSRCKGLIEAPALKSHGHNANVEFMHRTVRDFVSRNDIQEYIRAGDEGFDPHLALCTGVMLRLKNANPQQETNIDVFHNTFDSGAAYSKKIKSVERKVWFDILFELGGISETLFNEELRLLTSPRYKDWVPLLDEKAKMLGVDSMFKWAIYCGVVPFVQAESHHSDLNRLFPRSHSLIVAYHEQQFNPPNMDMIRFLLEKGANPNKPCESRFGTPWNYLRSHLQRCSKLSADQLELISLFNEHGAHPLLRVDGVRTERVRVQLSEDADTRVPGRIRKFVEKKIKATKRAGNHGDGKPGHLR